MPRFLSLSALLAVVFLSSPVFTATASIGSSIPRQAHMCVSVCAWYNYVGNLPEALGCADPYENDCYCPTASASVSKAGVALERCASSRCASGDFTRDLASLKSMYYGYCKDAGYSQDAAVLGYTGAPTNPTPVSSDKGASSTTPSAGQKSDSSSQPSKTQGNSGASTTTQKTVITQTKTGGADGSGTQVIVQETEIVIVSGGDDGSTGGTSMAVKIGVGVAVPVVVLLLAGLGIFFWRKRKSSKRSDMDMDNMSAGGPVVSEPGYRHDPEAVEKVQEVTSTVKMDQVSDKIPDKAELASRQAIVTNPVHEVYGGYNKVDELHGGYNTGLHEAHGAHTRPELPG